MSQTKTLLAVLVVSSAVTSVCSAQFTGRPLVLRTITHRDEDPGDCASLMLVPPTVYTTGDPMPLGTRVEFRVQVCERNEDGKVVRKPLRIVSGGRTFVGAPLNTTQVILPESTHALRLAVTAVLHGSESRPRFVELSTPRRRLTPWPIDNAYNSRSTPAGVSLHE